MPKVRFTGSQFPNVTGIRPDGIGSIENIPHPPMLVEGLIPRGAIVMVSGPSHVGKTMFAADLLISLALKRPYMGEFEIKTSGNSLLIEQDAPKLDTGRVLWAMARDSFDPEWTHHHPEASQPLDALNFLWHKGFNLYNGQDAARIVGSAKMCRYFGPFETYYTPPVFNSNGDLIDSGGEPLQEQHVRQGVDLIIYDSFRSLHTAEENDSGEMEAVVQELKWIREATGATQIILHHENAGGERPRGSTAIEAAMDTIFRLKRPSNSNIVTCTVSKARIIQPPSFKFRILSSETEGKITKSVEFIETIEVKEQEAVQNNLEDNFLAYIVSSQMSGVTRMAAIEWGILNDKSVRTIERWLAKMAQSDQIRVERTKEGARYFAI
jgi:hypothetical protein